MNGLFIASPFTQWMKALVLLSAAFSLLLVSDWLTEQSGRPFEFLILILLSVVGLSLMISSGNLIAFYMGLELSSLALYVLASFERDHAKSSEAGLKYFVLGSLASGMTLFGASLVYGFTGTVEFSELARHFVGVDASTLSKGALLGLILVMVGFCFKLSAVPFHMWTPDVYEGAPTPVAAFFATAPKVGMLALFIRFLLEPFGALFSQWQQIIIFVSAASLLVGAVGGIAQSNIKRLLAYSSIGHVGFMLIGLAAGTQAGVQAMFIYLALYIFMNAGAFACILLLKRDGETLERMADLAGLSRTRPWLAFCLAAFMFSMAGIPPLAGFFGKLYIVLAAVQAQLAWLAVLGVLASSIACYYYLRIIKLMYFDAPHASFLLIKAPSLHLALVICAVFTLGFFLYPTPLLSVATSAASAMMP